MGNIRVVRGLTRLREDPTARYYGLMVAGSFYGIALGPSRIHFCVAV